MNPWLILGVVLALAGVFAGGDHFGYGRGINEQKVADQAEFDRFNRERDEQKAEANDKYRKQQDANLALMAERDQLKTHLEKEREKNRKATDDLRARYAGLGLRFAVPQSAGLGRGGGCAQGAATDPASAAGATVVQLPDALAADLRSLQYAADQLADDYRQCYDYAQRVR
jgi:hypothetical protein